MSTKSNLAPNITSLAGKLATAEAPLPRVIPLDLIDADPQVRTVFDEDELQELAETIKAHGVQQPVKVRPKEGGRYVLVFGERRVRASRLANMKTIPAYVEEMDDAKAEDVQFIENIQRAELSTAELAAMIGKRYNTLKERGEKAPLDAIAAAFKKSKSWVSKYLSAATKLGHSATLLQEGHTQDIELLLTLEKIQQYDWAAYWDQHNAIKSGKGNRDTVRAALEKAKAKADKLTAEKKAAKKAAKTATQEPKSPPPFDPIEALEACSYADNTIAGELEKWGSEGRAKVEELLRTSWSEGKAAAARGPGGMVPELMRLYVAAGDRGYYDAKQPAEFRAYLAGAAGEAFDLEAILTDTRKVEAGD